jgi:hypothetical protein
MTAAADHAGPEAAAAARRRVAPEPVPVTAEPAAAIRPIRRPAAAMNPRSMAMLQRNAGNAAVAGLMRTPSRAGSAPTAGSPVTSGESAGPTAEVAGVPVQRLAPTASFAPPVPPPAADPASDPKFRAVTGTVKSAGAALRKHPPAKAEVGKAQAAAKGPPDDKAGQAKAAQADAMAAAKPGGFDKVAFIAAVRKAIADAAPKNLDEADKFAESGKADGVKNQVMSQVTAGKDTSTKTVKDETGRTPDASAGQEKPVTPLAAEPAVGTPKVDGAAAMPGPAPAEQVNFAGGPAQVDQQMADAQVTEQHLTKSNEPQLQEAATAKKGAEAHAAAAPAAIRAHESAALGEAKADAGAGAAAAMAGMGRDKAGALARVAGAKTDTKSKDEVERARISGEINKIFDQTKAEVEVILNGIDGKVTAEFDKGEGAARSAFTAKHKADMAKYKDDRYSGVTGAARWTADLFTGLPAEANKIYDAAKALYESQMTVVISNVADLIGRELDAAKARVEKGRAQIKSFIASQPAALQKLAGEAAKEVSGKFDQLDADVDAKQQSLVDDLASKYVEARDKVDEEIKAEQEKNKGLVDKAKEAIGGAIDTILKLKALFTGLLAKAASAFTKILEDPVAFITNFMSAVKQGFLSFAGNILTHRKKGLLGWLFGALASAGIELPDSFDVKGILKLVGSILGLTWTNIKARIAKLAPWAAAAIDVIQSKIEIFTILATQGIGGLWNWIKEKLGDLKSLILTPIMDFVKEKIITAGISWVIGMLNPAGALVKIVQALVGVVQWIMERGAALMVFVGTVIDSVTDIANGGVGGVPAKIEAALGKAVPLVIAFLANLLGLGGISDKIKSLLKAVQAPINKALDAVIKGALKLAAPLIKGIKGIGAKVKAKVDERRKKSADKNLKKKAEQELRSHIGGQVASPAPVTTAINSVYSKYRPQGLAAIKVKPINFATFDVGVTVSRMKVKVGNKFHPRDFKIKVDDLGKSRGIQHTAATGKWNGAPIPRQQSRGEDFHAEDGIMAWIRANRDSLPGPGRGRKNEMVVNVTKSPCPRCAGRLTAFAAAERANLTVAMTGFYRGEGTKAEARTNLRALVRMVQAGVKLEVPSTQEVLRMTGGELDVHSREKLVNRLAELRRVVTAVNERAEEMKKAGKG